MIRNVFRALIVGAACSLAGIPAHAQTDGGYPIEIVPVTQHSTTVLSAALSPDGRYVLSGSSDSTIKLWESATGRLIRTFEGHKAPVNAVLFTRDGKQAISAGADKVIRLWDLAGGRVVRSFEGHTDEVKSIALSRDGATILSASFDKTLRLWDLATARPLRTFTGHTGRISSVAISPDGKLAASSDWEATIRLWDIATGQTVRTFKTSPATIVWSVVFSPDGTKLASANFDKTARLWDVASGRLLKTFTGHAREVVTVAFSPDGSRLMSGGYDGEPRLWDVATGQLLNRFALSERWPYWSLVWAPDGKKVLAGTRSAALIDPVAGKAALEFKGSSALVNSVAMLSDSTRAISAGNDTTLKLWDLRNGHLLTSMAEPKEVYSVAMAPDGVTVLSGNSDGQLRLWDSATGRQLRTLEGKLDGAKTVALSNDGKLAAGGGYDKSIKLWAVATGRLLRTLTGTPNAIGSVAFSPDGSRLVSSSFDIRTIPSGFDSSLRLWDVASGRLLRTLTGHDNQIRSVRFSADGSRIVSGSNDKTIKLWNAANGEVLRTFTGHSGPVGAVAISANGSQILSGSYDQTIKLWDVASGNVIRTFAGHSAEVVSVAFSADGKRVLSGSADTTMRVWDLERGTLQVTFLGTADNEWLAITPEGFFAASDRGANMLSVVHGLDVFSIERFFQSLYRPDLVAEKLAGDPAGLVRIAATRLDLSKVLASGNAPILRFASPLDGEQGTSPQINAAVDIAVREGGVGRVEWRVNGVTRGVETPAPGNQQPRLTRQLALEPGSNTIEVVAYNNANLISSEPARVTITMTTPAAAPASPAAAPKPKLFVLAAGSNDYADKRFKLTYSVADARAITQGFTDSNKGLYASVEVKLLTDSEVTAAKLDSAFAELANKVGPSDVVLVYLAGHGKTVDGRYYFVPQNFKIDGELTKNGIDEAVRTQGVAQEQWQRWFASMSARKSVIMFDTCESGTLASEASATKALEQGAANDRLAQATGRSIFTASSSTAVAFEGYHGHGLFTYTVLDALDRGDSDRNGTIEVSELAAFVYAQVTGISEQVFKERQEPQIKLAPNYALVHQAHVLPAETPMPAPATSPPIKLAQPVKLQVQPNSGSTVVRSLTPQTSVTVLKSESGWSLIALDGKPIGYVATRDLTPMQ